MRWETGRRSENIEDRRGQSSGISMGGMGGIGAVIVLVIALLTGIDPSQLLGPSASTVPSGGETTSAPTDPQADFVSVILADTEDTWSQLLAGSSTPYQPPRLVLFTNATRSACGLGQAAMGPFYCPSDNRVYIDLRFFRDLDTRFGAPGDFAQAYVVAHEVGHHVQNLLGIADRVRQAQSRAGGERANALQVRMELQADCFAGVWAHHAHKHRQLLEPGDVEEGLRAAAAIGDDTLQRRAQGHVTPETWTHGSSAQRAHWFKQGLATGNVRNCDTFSS
jgi:uncharacterized protein